MSNAPPSRRGRSFVRDGIRIYGARKAPFRDVYHGFLKASWWVALGAIVGVYLGLNACFAAGYLLVGGISGARPGSFLDAYYFSIQTMGTIGYGAMFPGSAAANALVIAESVSGLLVTALATGLTFSKFSQSTSRLVFGHHATIGPMDGVPTLMFRLGNERDNPIIEAQIRVSMIRTERTKEGMIFYRMTDLALVRDRSPALARSWTAMHVIGPSSPLHGESPASLAERDVELIITVLGIDDTSLQPVHSRHRYLCQAILWGARHADILSEDAEGNLVLDLHKFHDIVPTEPTPDFPYPAPASPALAA